VGVVAPWKKKMLSMLVALTKYNDFSRIRANVLRNSFAEKFGFQCVYSIQNLYSIHSYI
jgi:hypothetical protein